MTIPNQREQTGPLRALALSATDTPQITSKAPSSLLPFRRGVYLEAAGLRRSALSLYVTMAYGFRAKLVRFMVADPRAVLALLTLSQRTSESIGKVSDYE